MSTLSVTTINTASNTTPLTMTTGNTSGPSIDIMPSNSTVRFVATNLLKNGSVLGAGKQTMWLPAAAFTARLTNGPALNQVVSTTNSINYKTYDFDPATAETIELQFRMPKSWDKGTITYTPVFSQLTTSAGSASWNLAACVASSGDSTDVAFSTPITVTVSAGTANILYIGAESAAITPSGSPQDGDLLILALSRGATLAADTVAIDARLHGINLFYSANTDSDA